MDAKSIAWIVVQALQAGVDMREIAAEVNASGEVSAETWDRIASDVRGGNAAWEQDPKLRR